MPDAGSAFVNASLGHGSKQALGSMGSHGSGAASAIAVGTKLSAGPLAAGTADSDVDELLLLLAQALKSSVAVIHRA